MPIAIYRVCKARYPVFDGTGAFIKGSRWNSQGRLVVYAREAQAGSMLEILIHAGRTKKLPGAHHGALALIPDDVALETADAAQLPRWADSGSPVAHAFGDRWLQEQRTAVLRVPAAPAQPFGRSYLLNPVHPDYARMQIETPAIVPWDPRLFRI